MAANRQQGRRGPYNRTSNRDRRRRRRIIEAFESDELDYVQVAETLGVKRQTARSIIVVYLRQNIFFHKLGQVPSSTRNIRLIFIYIHCL